MVVIYCLLKNNIPFYVGKSKRIESRYRHHKGIYGKDIEIIILDEVNDEKNIWKFWETFYIHLFKSWNYILINQNNGGGGPEQLSEYSRKLISESKKGCKVWSKGKKFSKEHSLKISQNSRGKKKNSIKYKNQKNNAKSIIQYDLEMNIIREWSSMKEAANFYKITPEAIGNCCKNKCKTTKGYKWKIKQKMH